MISGPKTSNGDKAAVGGTTRRDFVKTGAAVVAAVPIVSAAVPRSAEAAAKKGGHLRVGVGSGSTTHTLDPGTLEDTHGLIFSAGALTNCLTVVGKDGSLEPDLAESWESTKDAKSWTFSLRKGVEFHNGQSFTADDVVASLRHHMGEESKSAAKPLLSAITEIKTDGANRVTVALSGGNADFPVMLSDYHLGIMPSKDGAVVDAESGVGTGPYVKESFEPGVRSTGTRYENYHRDTYFDSVELLAIHDVAARTNALSTGEVDIIDRCDLKTVHLLSRKSDLEITSIAGTQHYTFPMRTDISPYDNNDVRLALKYGVDRQKLVDTILRGYGSLGNDHPIGLANRFHAGDLPQRAYDPDKAKFHMKKAGLDTLTVDLHTSDGAFGGAVDAATLYREHASKAGIDINVVREPADGYWSNVWMNKAWCACYWSGRPTEDLMFSSAYQTGVPWNDSFWSHAKFDALLIAARAETDEAKRRTMYFDMQQIVSDEGGVVVPMFANYVGAHSTKLAHGYIGKNYDMDGGRILERWWFA